MTHLWVEEELPVGNVTYRRTFGILRVPPTLIHHSDAILASKRIFNPFLGIRVVKPDFINPETVFIPSGW
jgi:hypothetical protein